MCVWGGAGEPLPFFQTNKHMRDLHEEDEEKKVTPCETCDGSGEVGPYGWEYPEYDTCPACNGSGVEDDGSREDFAYDRKKDDSLTV